MRTKISRFLLALAALVATSLPATTKAAELFAGPALLPSGFEPLGRIKPRSARQIAASNWSIGGETLDRDFAVYANYKRFLGPLGAKGIRMQAGWAKCERKPGVYDWAWLDECVDDALSQGVQPWLETSYGNTLYPEGGGVGLAGGLPKSEEALAAWDNWVRALVIRYRNRVDEWEIWNEPDLGKENTPDAYAALFIRTATLIRTEQPRARIYALALAGNLKFAEAFLDEVAGRGKLALITAVTLHGYPRNPDDTGPVDKLRAILGRLGGNIHVRQGETGAPSKFQENFALSKLPWSEATQAKWNLRRMLAHWGKDAPFNLFTISDLHYLSKSGDLQMNYKGLLGTNPDKTVSHRKLAYGAAQHVFSLFDSSLVRLTNFTWTSTHTNAFACFAGSNHVNRTAVVALWLKDAPPSDSNRLTTVDLVLHGVSFSAPVYADLLTGRTYAIPRKCWRVGENAVTFSTMPLYDSPVLLAERTAINLDREQAP